MFLRKNHYGLNQYLHLETFGATLCFWENFSLSLQNRSGGLSRVATVVNELMEEITPESFSQDLFASSTTTAIQRLAYLFE